MTDATPAIDTLLKNLDQALFADRHRLRRQLHELRKHPDEAKLAQWLERFQASAAKVEARRRSVPSIRYDDSLPIAAKRDEIKAALEKHQVLVIAGETGSGKTTQLPKICLEIGRGVHGLIGHTQPRRLAARSVATRVAEEIGTPLGELVGYQVRFEDQSKDSSLIKLMTDGILLAETQHDRFLERYDTIIVDEAHERSLNIDFLLGFLKTLLPRRPDLKVIITSATIDLQRFSEHFDGAPIVEVSGRTYPVETWYRPLAAEIDEDGNRVEDDLTVDQGILAALDEITTHEQSVGKRPGDVLVFLPGEREIRDAAEVLRKANLKFTEVLPLYARLTPAEQQKIFQPRPGRKIVLATNVAETSLTVPGIRYVIDSGTARISRYSYRAKVQRLPIEAVSQASANQRKGRCGRVEPGICIRLYSEGRLPRPARIHRSGDPAHQPRRGDPADAASALGRHPGFPPYRAAGWQGHQRRLQPVAGTFGSQPRESADPAGPPAGAPADRPATGSHASRSRTAGQPGRGAYCRQRTLGAGRARTSGRPPAGRRSGPCAVEGPRLGLRRADQYLARF